MSNVSAINYYYINIDNNYYINIDNNNNNKD